MTRTHIFLSNFYCTFESFENLKDKIKEFRSVVLIFCLGYIKQPNH